MTAALVCGNATVTVIKGAKMPSIATLSAELTKAGESANSAAQRSSNTDLGSGSLMAHLKNASCGSGPGKDSPIVTTFGWCNNIV
mmetsp:Transcript_131795/g.246478  ORF Transcript_131795/g.246478 Transcript_131795/m.246478 type:complete len:85 (+) Transcript_131795:2-256(+)